MNNTVYAKVNEKIQKEAAIVLSGVELTISDACRLLLTHIAREKALPVELAIANKENIKNAEIALAMKEKGSEPYITAKINEIIGIPGVRK